MMQTTTVGTFLRLATVHPQQSVYNRFKLEHVGLGACGPLLGYAVSPSN